MSDSSLLSMAQRQIAKHGVTLTVQRHVASTLTNSDKPWRGYSDPETEETNVCGVILPMERNTVLNDGVRYESGELILQSDEKAYVSGDVDSIRNGDKLVNGSTAYTVMQVKNWRSAGTSLLWELWVRR